MSGAPWVWPPVKVEPPITSLTSDQIVNLSSVAGATVTVALDQLGTDLNTLSASLAAAQLTANPYIVPPSTPNAFDDEFSSGSADLATRGYLIINAITGAVLTRSGNINPLDAVGPAVGTYWSTLIGSWLYVQGPPGLQIDIVKTIVLAAGDLYCARMVGTFNMSTTIAGRFNEVGLYGWTGTVLDNNNRVWALHRDDLTPASYLQTDFGRVTGGVGATALRVDYPPADIKGIAYVSGTTHLAFGVDGGTGRVVTQGVLGAPAAGTLVRFGIRNQYNNGGSSVPQIWGIDFIRKKTGGAWLLP